MSDTTTPNQNQKRSPLALDGSYLGSRVTLAWKSRGSEGAATGILDAVHHELETHWRGGYIVGTRARLAETPGYMVITGWCEAQPLEPNTTPSN